MPTPFLGGVPRTSWWYSFKWRHHEFNIRQAKRLDISQAQRLTTQSYFFFYQNLQSFYNEHNYVIDHIWNFDEIGIQARKQSRAKVLAKRGSHQVYNTIPKSKEWLTIKCVVNAIRTTLLRFHIFKRERICDDYI